MLGLIQIFLIVVTLVLLELGWLLALRIKNEYNNREQIRELRELNRAEGMFPESPES